MKQLLPHTLRGLREDYMSSIACSRAAVLCAATDLVVPYPSEYEYPEIDRYGYARLQDMTIALKKIFQGKVRYCYVKPGFRVSLKEFTAKHSGEKYIICVRGHYVYFNGTDYYSYFNNEDDEVIAVWRLF